MASTYLTPDVIAKEALVQAKNNIVMIANVDRQLDAEFTRKVGESIRIRKPVRLSSVNGPDLTGALSDIIEGSKIVTLDKFKSIGVPITSKEMTLKIEDFSKQIVEPAMIELVQNIESDIAAMYKEVWWKAGTAGTTPSTFAHINAVREKMDLAGVPMDNQRYAYYNPQAVSALSDSLKNVFPQEIARTAIERTRMGFYAGFNTYQSQSLVSHTVGNYGGTPLVNGASQSVTYDSVKNDFKQTLNTDGWTASVTGLLKEGDTFTIAGVYAVNPKTRQSTGQLQDFVVRADVNSTAGGVGTLSISPAIIVSGPYQTVTTAPADNAAITVTSGAANAVVPQNMAFHKNAFTLAMANLEVPMAAKGARESMDGISVRVVYDYDGLTDQQIVRFDMLYTVAAQNPAFAVRHLG